MTLSIIELIISCVVIFIGTEILVNSSVALSNKLKIPRVVVGTLIVSLATSLPELFVSLKSVSLGFDEFALGNIIGSNISNIGLVLGVMSLISRLTLLKDEIIWCFIPLLIVSVAFVLSIYFLNSFDLFFGLFCILLLIIYSYKILNKKDNLINELEFNDNVNIIIFGYYIKTTKIYKYVIILTLGSLLLYLGTDLLIKSSKNIAEKIGISDRVISISLVAMGTSLPELFASIYAVIKSELKMAVGNILGSNIFNILAVLGVTSVFNTISISNELASDSLILMLFTILIMLFFVLSYDNEKNVYSINRNKGIVLLIFYIGYITILF
tara:strand:+ start:1573 stop:2550 length:978 start_codon:yes stop_codon:yes gene_type:complete